MSDDRSNNSVRRRPPTASNPYGTNEADSLLRYAPYSDQPDGHPVYHARRRVPVSWYKQPQKLVMIATVAWIGGVMYLANLAHAILRSRSANQAPVMGSTGSSFSSGGSKVNVRFGSGNYAENDADYKAWLENKNMYGSSNYENDADYKAWLENKNKYGSSNYENDADYKAWLENKNKYGMKNYAENDADYKNWLDSKGYQSSRKVKDVDVNVRRGNKRGIDSDASYDEWLQYQKYNNIKYSANGKYGKSQSTPEMLQSDGASSAEVVSSSEGLLDPSVSTIDWPMKMGLSSPSCTTRNGCSSSNNVTVLVVYGPAYHTHISEMAWNVATGVHTAFQSHIRHHPNSPLHGHIIYGHTSNITFLDVMDADAIIMGSPVYNGNIHPDVQNWINYWHIDADLRNKFGGAFVTAGGMHAGADGTIMSILRSMMVFQMMIVGGDTWTSPFGAVATMYEDPFGDVQRTDLFSDSCYFTEKQGRQGSHLVHPYFLQKAYGLGERITNVTVAWKNSSYVRW